MQEYEGKKCIETVSEKFNFEIFPVAKVDAASFLLCNHFAKINANAHSQTLPYTLAALAKR